VQRVERVAFVASDALPDSERGEGGHGSTGGWGDHGRAMPEGS
jgi:dUTP pyrophosphatase